MKFSLGGITEDDADLIKQVLPVPLGTFPFKYLGVPLSYKKLTYLQCRPLIDKILARVKCWTARFLSYAGRVQLIRSVIFGMQTFWAQIFMLPKKIIKEITSICRVFLWTGRVLSSKRALVAWDRVCDSKTAGGWNLLQIEIWNKAAMFKLLWHISSKKDKLWVRWVQTYYVKRQEFWSMQAPNRYSWNLRKLFKLRSAVQQMGGLSQMIHKGRFSTKKAYGLLRNEGPKVAWFRIIHCNPASPSSRFICWLGVLDRLPLRSRLIQWQVVDSSCCPICEDATETVEHLFFQCVLSWRVWSDVLQALGITRQIGNWQEELKRAAQRARKVKPHDRVYVMCFVECLYAIWCNRNRLVFDNLCTCIHVLVKNIISRVVFRCKEEWKGCIKEV